MWRVFPLLILLALVLSACGGDPAPASPTPGLLSQAQVEPTPTTAPAVPSPATTLPDGLVPGVIAGKITDAAGNPLTNAHVTIWGTTGIGSKSYFEAAVDDEGRYTQPVPSGVYEIKAYAGITYNDRYYNIWLHPVDGIDTPSQYTGDGLTKDFELRLAGPKPAAKTRPMEAGSYYGGAIDVGNEAQYYMFYGTGALVDPFVYPEGSVVRVDLAPKGSLLDGSKGEVITRELKGEEVATAAIFDVPLGDYTVRATLVEQDGSTTPMLLASFVPGGPYGEKIVPAESARAEFVPSRMGDYGFEPMQLFIIPA